MKLPVMTLTQAKKLAGKQLRVGSQRFVFDDEVKAGGQAIAIPLKNLDGQRIAFFRSLFAMAATQTKTDRTAWMIGQRLHLLNEAFIGAPQLWVNTESHSRPAGVNFDFAGTIHGLAMGTSWKSWKEDIEMGQRNEPATNLRLQFAKGLIQRLACLEAVGRAGFVHGDVSDANVMLDDNSGKVNLIDFDCFVFQSPSLSMTNLAVRDGGSKGTPGYIPDWLCKDNSTDLVPLGDRFARDMMLIELLGFREGDPIDLSPLYWTGQDELLEDIKTLADSLQLQHLQNVQVFELQEAERPSSFRLAEQLGLPVEDNTDHTLSAAPISPDTTAQKSGVGKGSDTKDRKLAEDQKPASPSVFTFTIPAIEDLPRILLSHIDRTAIRIGQAVLPLTKSALLGVLGIALLVVWIQGFFWLLQNVNVPLNLVLCGVLAYATFICLKNPKTIKKYLRL